MHVGNNLFYKIIDDKALEFFGPTIHGRLNCQNSNLKKEFMEYLEYLFKVDTINKSKVTLVVRNFLKRLRDQYRRKLEEKPRHEFPPIVSDMELKGLIEDVTDKELRKEGKTQPIQEMYKLHLEFNMFNFI